VLAAAGYPEEESISRSLVLPKHLRPEEGKAGTAAGENPPGAG